MTEDWKLQYPSTALRRKYRGNEEYAAQYRGESDKLLYQLKNNMRFQALGQLKMTRFFDDGTVITAGSNFGQDYVTVDVTRAEIVPYAECTITFINFPDTVQPMQFVAEIHEGEVEGIDYIKTYYTVESNCFDCEPIVFEIETTCTYTEGICSAEIISQDSDEGGTYVIWKVYTDTDGSRSGYGTVTLTAYILNPSGDTPDERLCEAEAIATVDCCHKDSTLRYVKIYWEEGDPEDPQIVVEGVTYYEVNGLIGLWELWNAAAGIGYVPFYVFPIADGGCVPFTWETTGPGTWIAMNTNKTVMFYYPPSGPTVCDDVTASATDRCETTDSFIASCCSTEEGGPLTITYTSLSMGCNETQNLIGGNGCPPYSWDLSSGGGSIVVTGENDQYLAYTSPLTNPYCANNPTIVLTDCCNDTTEIKIALNCYPPGIAYKICTLDVSGVGGCTCFSAPYCCGSFSVVSTWYYCDGSVYLHCEGDSGYTCLCQNNEIECPTCSDATALDYVADYGTLQGCSGCNYPGGGHPWNQGAWDTRTDEAKAEGCCPINPLTGLPF